MAGAAITLGTILGIILHMRGDGMILGTTTVGAGVGADLGIIVAGVGAGAVGMTHGTVEVGMVADIIITIQDIVLTTIIQEHLVPDIMDRTDMDIQVGVDLLLVLPVQVITPEAEVLL